MNCENILRYEHFKNIRIKLTDKHRALKLNNFLNLFNRNLYIVLVMIMFI